jgi:hypothetical protein
MSRDQNGKYKPGYCPNPKGRPRKGPAEISPTQEREEFFEDAAMPVTVIENGKRKTIPFRRAINRQLMRKAVGGDTRAMLEFKKTESRLIREAYEEKFRVLEALHDLENRCRKTPPENVPEMTLAWIRKVRAMLPPEMLAW